MLVLGCVYFASSPTFWFKILVRELFQDLGFFEMRRALHAQPLPFRWKVRRCRNVLRQQIKTPFTMRLFILCSCPYFNKTSRSKGGAMARENAKIGKNCFFPQRIETRDLYIWVEFWKKWLHGCRCKSPLSPSFSSLSWGSRLADLHARISLSLLESEAETSKTWMCSSSKTATIQKKAFWMMPIRSPQAQLKQCTWTAKWLLNIFLHFAAIGFLRRPNGLHVSPWQERMRNKQDPRLHIGKKPMILYATYLP